jgi:hypothetical protein
MVNWERVTELVIANTIAIGIFFTVCSFVKFETKHNMEFPTPNSQHRLRFSR